MSENRSPPSRPSLYSGDMANPLFDAIERKQLADLFDELGPDAPTLLDPSATGSFADRFGSCQLPLVRRDRCRVVLGVRHLNSLQPRASRSQLTVSRKKRLCPLLDGLVAFTGARLR